MRKKIIFISLALISYIPSFSYADPVAKPPSWIQYDVYEGGDFSSVDYFDANSAKKSGAIVTFKQAVVFKKLHTVWDDVANKSYTIGSEVFTRQIDCKYKTHKTLDRAYYAYSEAIEKNTFPRFREDYSNRFPYKDWANSGGAFLSIFPKLCK